MIKPDEMDETYMSKKMREGFLSYCLRCQIFLENENECNKIYFLPAGYNVIETSAFRHIQSITTVINTDNNTCGYDAFKYATKLNITLQEFRRYAGKNDDFEDV